MTSNAAGVSSPNLMHSIRRFRHYLRPHSVRLVVNAMVILGTTVCSAALIWMVGHGFDLLHTGRFQALPGYFLAVTGLVVLLQLLRYASYYLYEWMAQRVIFSVRRALYAHLLLLAAPVKTQYAVGDLLTRLRRTSAACRSCWCWCPASYSLSV